jgi:hypothetical protein
MNTYQLKFWQPVKPDPDIAGQNRDSRKGSAARHRPTDISPFAAVVRQHPTCPQVYRDPRHFFNATYLTAELKQLFKGVLGGLCGEGQRIFSLGGKGDISQTFLGLYHLTKYRPELQQVTQFLTLPNPQFVQVAGLTNFDLEIKSGMEIKPGLRIFTPWGYLAWQLGGSFAYSLVKIHDEQRVAPSQYLLRQLMGVRDSVAEQYRPTLLLVEDFLDYVQNAIAIFGIDAPFIPEILIFIENLLAVVEKSPYTVLVYSLPATETNLLTAVKNLLNSHLIINSRSEAYKPTGMASLTGQKSMGKNRQFSPQMLRSHAHNIGKNRQFSPRMLRPSYMSKKQNKLPKMLRFLEKIYINNYTNLTLKANIKAINQNCAVVKLDEHSYYYRSVSQNIAQKKAAKIWRVKGDRCRIAWSLSSVVKKHNNLLKKNHNYLIFISTLRQLNYINITKLFYQVIPKHWDRKLSLFMPNFVAQMIEQYISGILVGYRSNYSIKNQPLNQWHKLSEIDVAFKEVIARSPPK